MAAAAAVLALAVLGAPTALAGQSTSTAPTITGPADGSSVATGKTTFTFTGAAGAQFACSVDGGNYKKCDSPYTVDVADVARHTFVVRDARTAAAASISFTALPYVAAKTYPAGSLLGRAAAKPLDSFRVIVSTTDKAQAKAVAKLAGIKGKLRHEFAIINAVNATLPGWAVVQLAEDTADFGTTTVTEDVKVTMADASTDVWQQSADVSRLYPFVGAGKAFSAVPAIAVVDSGIDSTQAAAMGLNVKANVALASDAPGDVSDGLGHGTFVAGIAASDSEAHPGVAPGADLVSLKVIDGNGQAHTGDVIAAADWILQHKDEYGIRVANFSLHAAMPSSFRYDPLDQAVERLWFNGVVVVAASGNFGDGTAKPMLFAPGNDPFVITVGAADVGGTVARSDDTVAPWSAFGRTADGFAKPELVAPGRYMVGSIPPGSTIAAEKAANLLAPGLIRLSGTSFAAPVVAGAAADILAVHPAWTPDQVKGALMQTARSLPLVPRAAQGVGEVDVAAAAALFRPANANAALDRYVVTSPDTGAPVFDAVSWADAASTAVSWADVSWADVSWADVSWADVSWADVSWADVSWADVSWADVSWADVSWADVSWADVSWADVSQSDSASGDVSWADVSWADVSWADMAVADNAAND